MQHVDPWLSEQAQLLAFDMLREQGFDTSSLSNIDFVDAALCALTAKRFLLGTTRSVGNQEEGYIVLPV